MAGQNMTSDEELDSLLAQYEAATAVQPQAPAYDDAQAPAYDAGADRLAVDYERRAFEAERNEFVAQRAQEKHAADLRTLVGEVRGDLNSEMLSDDLVEAWIDARARQDEGLQQVWQNRDASPAAYAAAKRHLASGFHKMASCMPDPNLTADREAVAAAVRNTGGYAPDNSPPRLNRMSNEDFRDYVRGLGLVPGI
jgi:hypothetical protein